MGFDDRGRPRGRRNDFAHQFCASADLPCVVMAFFDSERRVFTDSWTARAADCPNEAPRLLIKSVESQLAIYTAVQDGDESKSTMAERFDLSSDYPLWITTGRSTVGIGKPIAKVFPILAFPRRPQNDVPAQQPLLRVGMAYVTQQLTEEIYSRRHWPQGLVEATMQVLSIGFFVVNAAAEVQYDGRPAEDISSDEPGWIVANGRLSLRPEAERAALHTAIREAASSDRRASIVSVMTGSGIARLAAVAPLSGAEANLALVLFERQRTDHQLLREHFFSAYSLTRSERLIAHEVLNGKSLTETAEGAGLSVATVRSYMKQIMSKTGTHRQSDLISLYYTSILPVGTAIAGAQARARH